jgi:hypothetical protein
MGGPEVSETSYRRVEHLSLVQLAALLVVGAALAGCATVTWEETKAAYVDGINDLLHKALPAALTEDDHDAVLGLYAKSLRADASFRRTKLAALARFDDVVRSHCTILEAELSDDPSRARARVALQVHGTAPGGSRRSYFAEIEVDCVKVAESTWHILEERIINERNAEDTPVRFTDEAARRGLWNTPALIKVPDKTGAPRSYPAGSGLAVGDIDNDGFDDVYLVNGPECRLFRNLGDGTFDDITQEAKVAAETEGSSRFALFADFDRDDRTDIFVGKIYGPNLLYHQNADATFSEVAAERGLTPTVETMAACVADFNGDGWLDIYVVNGRNPHQEDPDPPYNALNGFPNHLFINNGDGTIRDALASTTRASGSLARPQTTTSTATSTSSSATTSDSMSSTAIAETARSRTSPRTQA